METYFHIVESGSNDVQGFGKIATASQRKDGTRYNENAESFETRLIPKVAPRKSAERRLRPPTIIKPYRGQEGGMIGDLIRMSNYGAGVGETHYFPVPYRRTISQVGDIVIACPETIYYDGFGYGYSCSSAAVAQAIQENTVTYVTDADHISTDLGYVPTFGTLIPNPDSAIEHVKGSIVNDLSNSFDLLTEIAEFSETTHMVMNMIQSLRKPMEAMRKLHREYSRLSQAGASMKALSSLSSAWMQYRYGIMPVVYSIQDALDLYTQSGAFRTVRARESLTSSLSVPPFDIEIPYLLNEGEVTVNINGTGKAYYNSVALRTAAQIRVNVPATLWEITKFSWMIDWFANVGDFLNAKVYQYTSIATEENCCYALKMKIQLSTRLVIPTMKHTRNLVPRIVSGIPTGCGFDWVAKNVSDNTLQLISTTDGGGPFSVQSEEAYTRKVFDKGDVNLALSPSLTWKRGLDALSLTIIKTNNRLRKMR